MNCLLIAIIYVLSHELVTAIVENKTLFIDEADGRILAICPKEVTDMLTIKFYYKNGTDFKFESCTRTNCSRNLAVSNTSGVFMTYYLTNVCLLRTIKEILFSHGTTDWCIFTIFTFYKPQNSACETPALMTETSNIIIKCSTEVFPQAACEIHIIDYTGTISGSVSYDHTLTNENVQHYLTNCTWTTSSSNFVAGNYSFKVLIYPNVTNTKTDALFGVNATIPSALQLSMPTAKLFSNCTSSTIIKDGFMKPNVSAYCTCYLDNIGNPPGSIVWYNDQNKTEAESVNRTATLNITPASDNKQYRCSALTSLKGDRNYILYNITYAMGPTACEIKPMTTILRFLSMCNNRNISLNVTCYVNKSNAIPGVESVFYVNGSHVSYKSDSPTYQFNNQQELEIISPGVANITCQAKNAKFNSVSTNCNYSLQVAAPPSSSPSLIVENDSNDTFINVIENQEYMLTCIITDGIPPVSNLKVSCGNIVNVTYSGNSFTSSVKFTRNISQTCTCTAEHVTGCYINNFTSKQINVKYVTSITNFTTTSNGAVIENGTLVEFVCLADGNPAPKIILVKKNKQLFEIRDSYKLSFKKNMSCLDTGIYICQAENGIKSIHNIQVQELSVNVQCPLQFTFLSNISNCFNLTAGRYLSLNLEIFGYPEPKSFKFFKQDKFKNVDDKIDLIYSINNQYISLDKKIKLMYSSTEFPFGIIKLNIQTTEDLDFTNYTLVIIQDGFQNLIYSFFIQEVNETETDGNGENSYLSAAVGGGVAAGCIVVALIVLCAYFCTLGKSKKLKAFYCGSHKNYTTDIYNKDVFSLSSKLKGNLKKLPDHSSPYKSYKDIVPTITSASAVPKNMYKPEVKPKPSLRNEIDYYNFVPPQDLAGGALHPTNILEWALEYKNVGNPCCKGTLLQPP